MHKYFSAFLLISFIFSVISAHADMAEDLNEFFHSMGAATNATSPDAYHDQTAGYYSGGGISLRHKAHLLQPVTVQLPSIRAGCGGIDIHEGGFSHINSEQLVNFMKSVAQNSLGYAAQLAIKTVSPQVANIMTEMNNLATKINSMNISSCEVASTCRTLDLI